MTCAAIIAIKSAHAAKSRLREQLPPSLHAQLVQTMLQRVIAAAGHARRIAEVVLVSPERRAGATWPRTVIDTARHLNAAFELGMRDARARGHEAVLLLPADLARVDASTLDAFIEAGCNAGIAIAPDTAGTGTNALFVSLAHEIRLAFGAGSFALHRADCVRLGIVPAVVHSARLSLDVDTGVNLQQLVDEPDYEFLQTTARSVA